MHRTGPATRLLLATYGLLLLWLTAELQRTSPHWTSRLATVESLVARGTFSIDGSTFASTIDKVKIGGHFYSHQPPAHAVLTSVLYLPMYWSGMRFSTGRNAAYAVLTFLTNGLSTLLALALFFQALEWFALDYRTRLWTTAAVACGTLMLPYSTTFNVHGLVAAWLFTGFYYFLRAQRAAGDKQWLLLSGLAFASCAAMDHGTVFLYAAFWALLMFRGERRAALWFLLPASLTLLPTAIYYYSIGGSFKPFAARPELFAYAGSAWVGTDNNAREHLTGEGWNSLAFAMRYGFLCLFGPRGFLVYQPLIWLALYGLVRTLYRRLLFWQEALAITAGSAAMMLLLLRQYQLRRLELQRPLVCRVPSLMGLLRSSCHRIDRRAQVAGRAPAGDGGRFPLLRGGRCCRSLAPPESHGLSVAPL